MDDKYHDSKKKKKKEKEEIKKGSRFNTASWGSRLPLGIYFNLKRNNYNGYLVKLGLLKIPAELHYINVTRILMIFV